MEGNRVIIIEITLGFGTLDKANMIFGMDLSFLSTYKVKRHEENSSPKLAPILEYQIDLEF